MEGDAEVGVSELALDHDQGHAFTCHLDGVCVAQLMRSEATAHTGDRGHPSQLLASGRGFPATSGGRAADHAQQRSDRQRRSDLEPGLELIPRPSIHADLPPAPALATANQDRATRRIKVGLGEVKRFADP
jgi:hypothetical protein